MLYSILFASYLDERSNVVHSDGVRFKVTSSGGSTSEILTTKGIPVRSTRLLSKALRVSLSSIQNVSGHAMGILRVRSYQHLNQLLLHQTRASHPKHKVSRADLRNRVTCLQLTVNCSPSSTANWLCERYLSQIASRLSQCVKFADSSPSGNEKSGSAVWMVKGVVSSCCSKTCRHFSCLKRG